MGIDPIFNLEWDCAIAIANLRLRCCNGPDREGKSEFNEADLLFGDIRFQHTSRRQEFKGRERKNKEVRESDLISWLGRRFHWRDQEEDAMGSTIHGTTQLAQRIFLKQEDSQHCKRVALRPVFHVFTKCASDWRHAMKCSVWFYISLVSNREGKIETRFPEWRSTETFSGFCRLVCLIMHEGSTDCDNSLGRWRISATTWSQESYSVIASRTSSREGLKEGHSVNKVRWVAVSTCLS